MHICPRCGYGFDDNYMPAAPLVSVECRRCGLSFKLSADHEDVAHPFPGPICPACEDDEREEEYERYAEEYPEWDEALPLGG